jgi:hypothetical protein
LVKFIAIGPCPQGQLPGDIFEATEEAGMILVTLAKCAKVYEEPAPEPLAKRHYRHRDLQATES